MKKKVLIFYIKLMQSSYKTYILENFSVVGGTYNKKKQDKLYMTKMS